MNLWQALLLGLVQGLTEFIPVSSSGHLELVEFILNLPDANFHIFLECINIGTLLALLIYFRHRIYRIVRDIFIQRNYRLAINLVITTIPAGLAGLILGDFISENPFFSSIITVCAAMGIVGLIMMAIDYLPHLKPLKDEEQLTPFRALVIGLLQVFALIPGTSRSGTTIIAGRLMGLNSESAAEYSFLASIPIMGAVCLRLFLSETSRDYIFSNLSTLIPANLLAFVVGLFALRFLLRYLKKPKSLQTFGRYRVIISCLFLGIILIFASL